MKAFSSVVICACANCKTLLPILITSLFETEGKTKFAIKCHKTNVNEHMDNNHFCHRFAHFGARTLKEAKYQLSKFESNQFAACEKVSVALWLAYSCTASPNPLSPKPIININNIITIPLLQRCT